LWIIIYVEIIENKKNEFVKWTIIDYFFEYYFNKEICYHFNKITLLFVRKDLIYFKLNLNIMAVTIDNYNNFYTKSNAFKDE